MSTLFDTPPWTEMAIAAGSTALVVAAVVLEKRLRAELFLWWATVAAVVLVWRDEAPLGLLLGVGLVVAADRRTESSPDGPTRDPRVERALLLTGVAVVAVALTDGLDADLRLGAFAVATAATPLVWQAFHTTGPVVTTIALAGTCLGVYINVPDTEPVAIVGTGLAVLAAGLICFPPLRRTTTGVSFGAACLLALLVVLAAGALGARGRPTSFIGVAGALGVLVAEPLAALIRRGTRAHAVVLLAVHAGAAFIAGRIAGERPAAEALWIVAAVLAGATVVLTALPRRRQV